MDAFLSSRDRQRLLVAVYDAAGETLIGMCTPHLHSKREVDYTAQLSLNVELQDDTAYVLSAGGKRWHVETLQASGTPTHRRMVKARTAPPGTIVVQY
jgi:hypothetical protein